MWAEVKAKNADFRYITYDPNNERITNAMKEHAAQLINK